MTSTTCAGSSAPDGHVGEQGHDVTRWRVAPGHGPGLHARHPADTSGAPGDRAATEAATSAQIEVLAGFQDRLWAQSTQSLLLVLQGIDASGKDGTIKHVFRGVNPQGVRVTSFKVPTPIEAAHDFLWRVHQAVPRAGEVGIFNRSHYEDVIVPRVHGTLPEEIRRARYDHIVGFEGLLAHGGTSVVKVLLHISSEEQDRRFTERMESPDKRWKLEPADFLERRSWTAYQEAYEEVLARTSTEVAPWYVVPADHKWFRNWVVGEILLHVLLAMDPRYPEISGEAPASP